MGRVWDSLARNFGATRVRLPKRMGTKKLRLALESVVGVGAVVTALSAHHETLAYALGTVAGALLFLDLFGNALWVAFSGAVVRAAVDRGAVALPDPQAVERERKLRATLQILLAELQQAERFLRAAIGAGEFWTPVQSALPTPIWTEHKWFLAEWPQLVRLFSQLDSAYFEVERVNGIAYAQRHHRAVQVGHGLPVKTEDELPRALAAVENVSAEVRAAIATLP